MSASTAAKQPSSNGTATLNRTSAPVKNEKTRIAWRCGPVFLTMALILIGAACCNNIIPSEDDIDVNRLPSSSVVFKLDKVRELPGTRPDLGLVETREFDVYLERPDLGLKEVDWEGKNVYTSDLPLALQAKRMYISEVTDRARDSGNSGQTSVFPHRFTMNMNIEETKKPKAVLLKVIFGDKTYAEGEITIPYAGSLDEPVIMQPQSAPKNGDKFQMQFKDVGADNYRVGVNICRPYANDGINPCLKGFKLDLTRRNGKLNWEGGDAIAGISIKNENGIVLLHSEYPFTFTQTDTSVLYSIKADAQGVTPDGTKTYLESRYQVEYRLK